MFKCNRCGYETNKKNNLLSHLRRKFQCKADLLDVDCIVQLEQLTHKENDFICIHCNEGFGSLATKYRHQSKCCVKKSNYTECLENRIEMLENQLKKVTNGNTITNCTINIQTQNNVQNNVQQNNNITLENFGKENVEFLADSFIRRCLFKAFDGVGDLTQKIHFNPDKPEYHNVTTTNKKDGFLEVFKNGKWIYDDKNKVLDALIKQSFDIISSHYDQFDDEIKAELSPTNFKRVDRFVESVLNQDKTIQNSLRKCLYLLILNNRHVVSSK